MPRSPSLFRVQAASFAAAFEHFMITPALGGIAKQYNVSLAEATITASLYYLAYGVMQMPWGLVSERFGRVRTVSIGLGLGGLLTMIGPLSPTLTILALTRLLAGGCMAAAVPALIAWIGDNLGAEDRTRAAADMNAAYAVGSAAGVLVAGVLAQHFGWEAALVAGGIVALAGAVLVQGLPQKPRAANSPSLVAGLRRALSSARAVSVALIALVEGGALFGVLAYLAPTLLATGSGAGLSGAVVAAYGISVVFWAQVPRKLGTRLSAPFSMAMGGALLTVAWLLAALDPAPVGVLVAAVLAAGALALLHAQLQLWATSAVPEARGAAVAMFAGCLFIGAALGTALLQPLFAAGHIRVMFGAAAVIAALVTLVAVLLRRRLDRH